MGEALWLMLGVIPLRASTMYSISLSTRFNTISLVGPQLDSLNLAYIATHFLPLTLYLFLLCVICPQMAEVPNTPNSNCH